MTTSAPAVAEAGASVLDAPSAHADPSRRTQAPKAAQSAVSELAAEGGPKPYVWARNWWPISPVNYLDPLKPTPRTILGTKLALWHHATQGWCAVADSCPHRLAPLSEGRVVAGGTQLACSYHGWKFDDTGKCTTIPQLPDSKAATTALASPRSCAVSYPTTVVGGLLFVWMDVSKEGRAAHAAAPKPAMPPAIEGASFDWTMNEAPNDYTFWVEQGMDPAHANFLHHGSESFLARVSCLRCEASSTDSAGAPLAGAGPSTSSRACKLAAAATDSTPLDYRFNDDGEPGGTAGRPILQAIEGQAMDGVVVVVTRWYGGIKLGAGGLVRATLASCGGRIGGRVLRKSWRGRQGEQGNEQSAKQDRHAGMIGVPRRPVNAGVTVGRGRRRLRSDSGRWARTAADEMSHARRSVAVARLSDINRGRSDARRVD
ncbi:MAG: hypothetical protein WDW36_003375 [Sanguina aurantia]